MLRVCLASAALALVVLAAPRSATVVTAASNGKIKSGPAVQVTLKEQLEKGLRARRPVEFEFVDRVVAAVESGQLPIRLVNSSYDWALRQSYDWTVGQPQYPFQYFQFAITRLAKKRGVEL